MVVDHLNNIKTDNRLDNLQLISQSQNLKKDYKKGRNLLPVKITAINEKSGKSFDYNSISKCSITLDINPGSISKVLKGAQKTAMSKKDKCKYTFKLI